jgi:plastocyanin
MRHIKAPIAAVVLALSAGTTFLAAPVRGDEPAPAVKKVEVSNPSITGKITFEGQPPKRKKIPAASVPDCAKMHPDGMIEDESLIVSEAGAIKDVVVFVSKNAPAGAANPAPATLNQKACRYDPHVLVMMVGQQLHVGNSDSILHNVHGITEDNTPFNLGQNGVTVPKKITKVKAAEQFIIKCDVHPWMSCRVHVFEHPYAAISDAEGNFVIANLPPGKYTLSTQHPKLGEASADLVVEAGKPAKMDFKLKLGDE